MGKASQVTDNDLLMDFKGKINQWGETLMANTISIENIDVKRKSAEQPKIDKNGHFCAIFVRF